MAYETKGIKKNSRINGKYSDIGQMVTRIFTESAGSARAQREPGTGGACEARGQAPRPPKSTCQEGGMSPGGLDPTREQRAIGTGSAWPLAETRPATLGPQKVAPGNPRGCPCVPGLCPSRNQSLTPIRGQTDQ